jgi:hypothetical protein
MQTSLSASPEGWGRRGGLQGDRVNAGWMGRARLLLPGFPAAVDKIGWVDAWEKYGAMRGVLNYFGKSPAQPEAGSGNSKIVDFVPNLGTGSASWPIGPPPRSRRDVKAVRGSNR